MQFISILLLFLSCYALENNEFDIDGLRCKLPGWPGHPAPPCDPALDQCCPGTTCQPDSNDPSHQTCQQTLITGDYVLTANILTNRVESLLSDALYHVKQASIGLFLEKPKKSLENEVLLERAKMISSYSNKAKHHDEKKKDKNQPQEDWHKYVQGSQPTKNDPKGKKGGQTGGYDYSKYTEGGGKGGGDADYSKYIEQQGKKDDKKKGAHKGKSVATEENDYSKYLPESSSSSQDKEKSAKGKDSKQGFDYSKYIPSKKTSNMVDESEDEEMMDVRVSNPNDDFLKTAAFSLLEADVQLRQASSAAKRDVLERVRSVLWTLLHEIDALEAKELLNNSTIVPDDNSSPDEEKSSDDDSVDTFWERYVPKMPNVDVNIGDRSPGTLGGPCGRTNYKDFGPCEKHLRCVSLTTTKPGLCKATEASEHARMSVFTSLKLAESAIADLKTASEQLLVGASSLEQPKSANDADYDLNSTDIPVPPVEYSPSTLIVSVVGLLVLMYFCFLRFGKRQGYRRIEGGSWAG